jgi:hypothetical protein
MLPVKVVEKPEPYFFLFLTKGEAFYSSQRASVTGKCSFESPLVDGSRWYSSWERGRLARMGGRED